MAEMNEAIFDFWNLHNNYCFKCWHDFIQLSSKEIDNMEMIKKYGIRTRIHNLQK